MEIIDSSVFGDGVEFLGAEDTPIISDLENLIIKHPINAFGMINKALNKKGYCLLVNVIPSNQSGGE